METTIITLLDLAINITTIVGIGCGLFLTVALYTSPLWLTVWAIRKLIK